MPGMVESSAVDGLIGALEAAESADRALDRAIAAGLGLAAAPVGQHARARFCGADDTPAVPRYTASLDACIPGENVVLALCSGDDGGRWVAVHRLTNGIEVVAWAATECLARRAAALRGWRTVLVDTGADPAAGAESEIRTTGAAPGVRPDAPWLIAAPADDEAAGGGWTIRF